MNPLLVSATLTLAQAAPTNLPPPFSDLTIEDVNRAANVLLPPGAVPFSFEFDARTCIRGPFTARAADGTRIIVVRPGESYPAGCDK